MAASVIITTQCLVLVLNVPANNTSLYYLRHNMSTQQIDPILLEPILRSGTVTWCLWMVLVFTLFHYSESGVWHLQEYSRFVHFVIISSIYCRGSSIMIIRALCSLKALSISPSSPKWHLLFEETVHISLKRRHVNQARFDQNTLYVLIQLFLVTLNMNHAAAVTFDATLKVNSRSQPKSVKALFELWVLELN